MAMNNIRTLCIGNCGRMVLNNGECRKCRKSRLHAGLKRTKKLARQRGRTVLGRVVNFFVSKKAQYEHSKTVYWNRPKRSIRGLNIKEKRRNPWL